MPKVVQFFEKFSSETKKKISDLGFVIVFAEKVNIHSSLSSPNAKINVRNVSNLLLFYKFFITFHFLFFKWTSKLTLNKSLCCIKPEIEIDHQLFTGNGINNSIRKF